MNKEGYQDIFGPGFVAQPSDLVLRNDHGYRGPGWAETPDPATGLEPDDAALTHQLRYGDAVIALKATRAKVFAALRSMYLISGPDRFDRFLRENRMVSMPIGSRGIQDDELTPEDFLQGDDLRLYRLLKAQGARVRALCETGVADVQELARKQALLRLGRSMAEVNMEIRRLMALNRSADPMEVLSRGVSNYPAGNEFTVLQKALYRLRGLSAPVTRTREAYADGLERTRTETHLQNENTLLSLERSNALRALRAARDEAQQRYVRTVGRLATTQPILWRLHAFEEPDDAVKLMRAVHEVLSTTWKAANDLLDEFAKRGNGVWDFPPLVMDALRMHAVPQESLAWRACEEKLGKAGGIHLIGALSMGSGLAGLGLMGLAMAGMAVASPVAAAVGLAEALFSVTDAANEFLEWRRNKAAFNATLNPSNALGAEPSTLGPLFIIAVDIVGAVTPIKTLR